ncbi:MAG: acetyl-CoA carboxylase biotin carboxyl carrier protein [Crocinitomicaceae bacterium]|nr:acetyl-CoA carboxylase biotin carboxyl carrier protein [Crocinitomicaceae bacterium]
MDIKEIQNLIKFVSKAGVNEVSIEQGDFKITIKTECGSMGTFDSVVVPQQVVAQPVVQQVVAQPQQVVAQPQKETPSNGGANEGNYVTIKSPMIGTFYRRSSPDKDPFVSVGDTISAGTVLCIVEAMKLFNEIESEISGKIVKVLVDDQSPIEYDQPLFLVDPS